MLKLTDITHRLTKEALIKYNITEDMIITMKDKKELRKFINQQSVKSCHGAKNYHSLKFNIDENYTKHIRDYDAQRKIVRRNTSAKKKELKLLNQAITI